MAAPQHLTVRGVALSALLLGACSLADATPSPSEGPPELAALSPPADVAAAMRARLEIGVEPLTFPQLLNVQVDATAAVDAALSSSSFAYLHASGNEQTVQWTESPAVYLVMYQATPMPHMSEADLAPRPAYLVQVAS